MTHDGLVLGFDGGGTGSRAILSDSAGRLIGFCNGPACNYQNSNPKEVEVAVSQLLGQLVNLSSTTHLLVDCAVFSLAGLDTVEDARILEEVVHNSLLDSRITAKHVTVENDGIVTLRGLVGEGPGAILLSGTGSIAWGIAPGREPVRSGGWGHHLGDEGSGYAIGMAALSAIFHGFDGRGPVTGMETDLLSALGCDSIDAVAEWAYSGQYSVSTIASLAPVVLALYDTGNPTAKQIIEDAAAELAKLVSAVATRLPLTQDFDLALCGGILENSQVLRDLVTCRIAARYPRCKISNTAFPSALGATAYALRLCSDSGHTAIDRLSHDYQKAISES
jgi:N-acetylglucosamine kinase-like BadF-type ATPase